MNEILKNNTQTTISPQETTFSNPSIGSSDIKSEEENDSLSVKKLIKKESQKNKKKKCRRVKVKIIFDGMLDETELNQNNNYQSNQSSVLMKYQDPLSMDLMSSTSSTSINNKINLVIEKPFDNYKSFLCAGDMLIEFYHEDELELTQERRICSYRNLKKVYKAEQVEGMLRIYVDSNNNVLKEFQYVRYLLESKQDQKLHQLSQLLNDYQKFIQGYQSYAQSILNYYKNTSMNDFNIIRELRQTYYIDYMNKLMAKQSPDEFVLTVQSGPSYINLTPSYHICQFSPALMALLGVDINQMQHLFLRHGMREMTIYTNKQDNYIYMLKNILEAIQIGYMRPTRDYPVQLFTFDNIAVKAHSNCDYYDVPLPKQLEFKSTTGVYKNLDKICLIRFCVDIQEIQKLINLRKQPSQKQIIAEQLDHFEYSIYSQIFIEKYYQNHNKQNNNSNI